MDKIELKNISIQFKSVLILKSISVNVKDREILTIVGPSGCGKSTLLQIAAGLYPPSTGSCFIDGIETTSKPGKVSFMHQKDLLLPWKTIIENIIVPLSLKGIAKQDSLKDAKSYIRKFGLEGFENYYPVQISGGMRQRAALLRTYLYRSDIMLLDEPLGALDAITRRRMQKWLLGIIEELKTTVLMVTHDIDEALLLSDRIIILTSLPAEIKDIVTVDLPHPRSSKDLITDKMIKLKQRIINDLGD
jgi:ABC-type nitrate/sulfonate/bicarbonate transport system ATPase subunit